MASRVSTAAKQAEQLKKDGNSCFKKERFGAAIDAYTEALDLGRAANENSDSIELIWQEFAKAKYQEWELESTKRMWNLQTLKYVFFQLH
ncbi:hypothetical protein RHGRI_002677 [Rhododendron griersonianum]|uniref:RING-type E3 ubiquitin transferase n=1 Tax=Rhododendron griersonianum TaxID=479676 RepID=A0AAV6LSF0_9ERIC|nr:hypothetical protein RHGRI_002677 [Rhododendron griersonianum]